MFIIVIVFIYNLFFFIYSIIKIHIYLMYIIHNKLINRINIIIKYIPNFITVAAAIQSTVRIVVVLLFSLVLFTFLPLFISILYLYIYPYLSIVSVYGYLFMWIVSVDHTNLFLLHRIYIQTCVHSNEFNSEPIQQNWGGVICV